MLPSWASFLFELIVFRTLHVMYKCPVAAALWIVNWLITNMKEKKKLLDFLEQDGAPVLIALDLAHLYRFFFFSVSEVFNHVVVWRKKPMVKQMSSKLY